MALGLTPKQIVESGKHPLLGIHKDWARINLEEVSNVQNGYAFKSKFFSKDKGVPLIRIRDIAKELTENLYTGEYAEDYIVETNDILVGMDGDFNVSKWPGKKGLLNQRVCRLTLYSEDYNKEFFFYCLQPYLDAINAETSAVTVKHLSSKTIKEIPLPLPPLPDQRAIVSKLEQLFSELEDGVANLQKARRQLKVYRQAVLKKAFEGELTREWRAQQTGLPTAEELLEQIQGERERYYEQQLAEWKQAVVDWEADGKVGKKPSRPRGAKKLDAFTSEEIKELPASPLIWSWVKLGEVADLVSGITKGGRKLDSSQTILTPYLRVANVQDGYLDLKVIKEIEALPSDIKKYELEYGDILYTEGGDKDKLGRGTIWKNEIPGCIHQNHIYRARLFDNSLNRDFVGYFSQTRVAKNYFFKHAKQTTNLASINLTVLANLPLPIPPTEEQHQIVQEIESRLSVCDQLEQDIEANLKRAERLRQSLLQKAFAGELLTEAELQACRAEPDWEPAEKLLARIKGEAENKA